MKSFCDISCILLFLGGCLFMSVNCQKKNKGELQHLGITQNTTVMEGERVVLRCRTLNNDTDATIMWIKDWVFQSIGPELVINTATVKDTGIYVCYVYNDPIPVDYVRLTVKQTTTSTCNTTTTGLQICMCGTSRSLVMTQNTTVMEGQRVVLICRTPNNKPDVTFHWIKRVSGLSNVIQSIGPELVIKTATVKDTGIYTCFALDIESEAADVWLTVKQTTTSTTTEPPTTTKSTTTCFNTGLQICMCSVYYK